MTTQYITSDKALTPCLDELKQRSQIALDLEFDKNRYRYGFNLCLVQISANGTCFLIDPLSKDLDIERLFPVIEDKKIEKVVFAFGEDLRLLHSLGCKPANLFDLSIATSLLNYSQASLSDLLIEVMGRETANSTQNSNWYKRPLTKQQKEYAASDVRHLLEMKSCIMKCADLKQVSGWIAEENAALEEMDFTGLSDNNLFKEKDKNGFSEYEWFLYKKLLGYREEIAKSYNKPGYHIIDKKYLARVARDSRKLTEWSQTRGIFRAIKTPEYKRAFKNLLQEGAEKAQKLNLSRSEPAVKPPGNEEREAQIKERDRINRLKSGYFKPIKSCIAEKYGENIASFILSNRIMTQLISGDMDTLEPYKRELFINCARELDLDLDTVFGVLDRYEV